MLYIDFLWLLQAIFKIITPKSILDNKQQIVVILQGVKDNLGVLEAEQEGIEDFAVVMQKIGEMGGFKKAAENLNILQNKEFFNKVQ